MEILENITENIIEIKTEDVIELVRADRYVDARKILVTMNEADIALLFEEIPEEKILRVFRMLPKTLAAESFSYMISELQQFIVESITEREIVSIVDEMFMDDTVDFLEEMPANVVKKVLKVTDPETRKIINQLLKYPDDSAGSIMTTEYVDLKKEMTVYDAISHIRATGVDKETINTCYVIDKERHLEGTVSIRKLILSQPDEIISDIMIEEPMYIYTHDDQETGAHYFKKYDLLSMPVVDAEKRLVGIITIDDIVDVIEQETTEDMELMNAVLPSDDEYLKMSVIALAKNRIPWLCVLMISGTLSAFVIGMYQDLLDSVVVLSSFMTIITGTGGNAGSQASAMIIRGLALGEIQMRDTFKVVLKELRVGAICGLILGIINMGRMTFFDKATPFNIDLTVSISMGVAVILAKTLGCALPIIAKAVKLDPAMMAGPLISTVVDAIALVVYFSIATALIL